MSATSSATLPDEPPSLEDQERLARVLTQNYDFVWRFLRRLGIEPGRLEDEAQRVFWIASKKLVAVPPDAERSFLVGVGLRVATNARRSQSRRREDSWGDELATLASPLPNQEELLDQKRRRELLDKLLDELDWDQRTVFVMSELEGLSREQIAQHLELPPGTVASRLRLARQHFERLVARTLAKRDFSSVGSPS